MLEIHEKYRGQAIVLWAGDINASLRGEQPNPHDKRLIAFCEETGFTPALQMPPMPTFYNPNGKSTSQIDYIMRCIHQVQIVTDQQLLTREPLNTSPHDVVVVILEATLDKGMCSKNNTKTQNSRRIKWEKVDEEKYQNKLQQNLEVMHKIAGTDTPVEVIIDRVTDILETTATNCAPVAKPCIKRKKIWPGFIIDIAKRSKDLFCKWKHEGRKKEGSTYKEMVHAKREL